MQLLCGQCTLLSLPNPFPAFCSPLAGDLALLNLGELFPAFPSQMPTTSQGATQSGRSQQVRE